MLGRIVALGEAAGRLEHDVDLQVGPGKLGGIALGEDAHGVAANIETAVGGEHVERESAVDRIVLEEVSQRGGVGEVVDRDEVDVGDPGGLGGPDDVAADPAESIDAHANLRHRNLMLPAQK